VLGDVLLVGDEGRQLLQLRSRSVGNRVVWERTALRGDPVGEMGEHSIVGRRLARQRKRRFQRGRRGTVAHLRDLPETWRVAGAGSAIPSNAFVWSALWIARRIAQPLTVERQ
jgi:hypothetical protein